jgi:hypothetical protein
MNFLEPMKDYHKSSSAAGLAVPLLLNEGYATFGRNNPSGLKPGSTLLQGKLGGIAGKLSPFTSTSNFYSV